MRCFRLITADFWIISIRNFWSQIPITTNFGLCFNLLRHYNCVRKINELAKLLGLLNKNRRSRYAVRRDHISPSPKIYSKGVIKSEAESIQKDHQRYCFRNDDRFKYPRCYVCCRSTNERKHWRIRLRDVESEWPGTGIYAAGCRLIYLLMEQH